MSKKVLNYVAPPAMAIAAGATTPDPGIAGISVWSTIENKMVTWNGTTWQAGGVTLSAVAATDIGTVAAAGTGLTAARSDHVHAHGAQTDGALHSLATGSLNGFMSSADFTKLASVATGATNTQLATVAPQALAAAAAIGSSLQAAKADHVHAHGAQPLGDGTMHALVNGTSAGFMSSADYTKLLGISPGAGSTPLATSAPPAIQNVGAVGTSSSVARGDHVHAHGNLSDGSMHALATGSLNGFMSSAQFTKLAGIAANATATALSTTVPSAVAVTGVAGSGTTASKFDHVHPHGTQTDGTLHAVASGSANGFMSAADFTKLAGIATGATAAPYGSTTPAALSLTATGAVGTSSSVSRADHSHPHGNQTISTLHAVATGSANGFLSAANFTKLAAVPAVVAVSAGAADAGKLPALDAAGKLDSSLSSAGSFDVFQNTITFTDQPDQVNVSSTGAKVYVQNYAERRMLAVAPANSLPVHAVQPCLGMGRVSMWNPTSSGAGMGWVDSTAGTVTYIAATGANVSTIATANSFAHLRCTWGSPRTYGFHYVFRFSFLVLPTRWFVGLSSAALGSGDPAAQAVNLTGFGQETGDALISFITSTGTAGQQVKTNLNNLSTPTVNVSTYEAHLFCTPGDTSKLGYMLRKTDVNPNVIASGIVTTGLPAHATTVYPTLWIANGANAIVQTMRVQAQYFEVD